MPVNTTKCQMSLSVCHESCLLKQQLHVDSDSGNKSERIISNVPGA
jgi:hypothetical protein